MFVMNSLLKKKIAFNNLDYQYKQHKSEYDEALQRVLDSGWYILGKEVLEFEKEYASYCSSKYCVGLNSGLDALILALRALGIGPGDEVIVPANTYIATVLGITENGATPIFVEPNEFYNMDPSKIEDSISSNTKAILPVHLFGQACQMDEIMRIAKKHNLKVIEDAAQSHGSCFDNTMTGSFGDVGCFSFYPTKNLGAFGDAGAIISNSKPVSDEIRMLRNYGSKIKYYNEVEGVNSRLDEIQASLLRVKLKHLNELTSERVRIAHTYLQGIDNDKIILPKTAAGSDHVYHLFVIRTESRDDLVKFLEERGIKTQIHYPVPPHLAKCYSHLGYGKGDFPITEQYAQECLSLPLYNGMDDEQVAYVIDAINAY